jgi:hypothetical protein
MKTAIPPPKRYEMIDHSTATKATRLTEFREKSLMLNILVYLIVALFCFIRLFYKNSTETTFNAINKKILMLNILVYLIVALFCASTLF